VAGPILESIVVEADVTQQRKATAGVAAAKDGDRRRTILRAAIDVFARKGYHGCRIADVAREAGVAYGLVYHYFKNKDELLETVFDAGWTGFVTRLRAVAEGEGNLTQKVHGISAVAFEAYRVDPRAVRVLILEIARSPAGSRVNRETAFSEVIKMSAHMLAKAQAAGELRADVDPLFAAALLFGAIEMGLTAFVVGLMDSRDAAALERAQVQIAESFLRGVHSGAGTELAWKPEKASEKFSTKLKASKRA
jgi:TetR/AcrR family transcriptional regulator, fatty acid metabolism regulator protein